MGKNRHQDHPQTQSILPAEGLTAIATIVIAVATVLSAFVSWVQWGELKAESKIAVEQAKISERALSVATREAKTSAETLSLNRDTALRQFRPYLIVNYDSSDLNEYAYLSFQHRVRKVLIISNVGSTPAYKVKWGGRILLVATPLAESDIAKPEEMSDDAMIGTRAADYITTYGSDKLSKEEKAGYRSGKYAFVTYGRLEYFDSYNQNHYTDYCFVEYYAHGWDACPAGNGGN
jgi:hypothetical protein